MEFMKYRKIDPERLRVLIENAREKEDFSSPELGEFVSDLCKIVLRSGNFRGYTEDWQLDMFGNACLAVFSGMRTAEPGKGKNLFNYFYTIAANACKRSLKRFTRDSVAFDEEYSQTKAVEPFYIRNRRRMLRGLVEANERKVVSLARARKMVRLEKVVGQAVGCALEHLEQKQIDGLLKISKRNRENEE